MISKMLIYANMGHQSQETRSIVSYCWYSKIPYSHLSSSSVLRSQVLPPGPFQHHHLIIDLVIDQTKSASATGYPLKPIPISAVCGFPVFTGRGTAQVPVSKGKIALTDAICILYDGSAIVINHDLSMDIQYLGHTLYGSIENTKHVSTRSL
jgi:hypothetical protein